jgi:hypothetical protein
LAQRILNTEEEDELLLAKQLLIDIDPTFQSILGYCPSFAALKPAIQCYYHERRRESINWPFLQEFRDFVLAGLFVLDLALSSGKENYIEEIIELPSASQMVLQPFVQCVAQRDQFVSARSEVEEQDRDREHLIEMAEENDKLRLEREHWLRKYQDLK